jgi:hypothetical protein
MVDNDPATRYAEGVALAAIQIMSIMPPHRTPQACRTEVPYGEEETRG